MSVFKEKYITSLFAKERYKLKKTPLFIFVAVDPSKFYSSHLSKIIQH